MFAKIFGPPEDQILAMIRPSPDDDNIEVRFFFRTESPLLDVCETALGYSDEAKAQEFFDGLTEEKAREVVAPLKADAIKFFS